MNSNSGTDKFSLPGQPVDLTNCEREPIHIPSLIQPHGILLALLEPELTIVQTSDNTTALLQIAPQTLLGKSLATLLHPDDIDALHAASQQEHLDNNPAYLLTMQIPGVQTHFDAIVHRSQGLLVLELEPVPDDALHQDTYALVRHAVPQIQSAKTLTQMFNVVAQQIQRINGFDRVMVYRFDAEGHGSVVAESKRDDLPAFLGLHYPASDIPAQARRLYTLNLLRLIADVGYTPSAVIPTINPHTQAVLDMSHCVLRSVSPIHVQYLKNMGVAASLSISILQEGELWGLVACHHYTPRFVSYDVRTACEFVGQIVSLQLTSKQDSADVAYQIRLKDTQAQLVASMANEQTYQEGLVGHRPNVLDFIEAEGAVVYTNGVFRCLGQVPDEAFLRRLIGWLASGTEQEVFATDALSAVFPPAKSVTHIASGLLAITVSPTQQHYVLWFRPEVIQTIDWAGDPTKPVEVQENGLHQLTPRGSFALWKETVLGKSLPWKPVEIDAAQELRRALVRVILHKAEQLEVINAQLSRSNAELDAFTYIASHDLREPLRGIRNYIHFIREDYGVVLDTGGQKQLDTLLRLTQRMELLIDSLLHYSRVGHQELALQPIDLNTVVSEVLEDLRPRLLDAKTETRVPRALPTLLCDAIQVSEIFTNLVSNAVKYNDKENKWVEIGFLDEEASRQQLAIQAASDEFSTPIKPVPTVLYVRDNGIGIQEKNLEAVFRIFRRLHAREEFGGGTGAGLTIARKLAERHGGRLWAASVYGEGTTFYFTIESEVYQEVYKEVYPGQSS